MKGVGILPPGARTVPQLRTAAKSWMAKNRDIPVKEFAALVTFFIQEPSTLKKCMGGILLGYCQRRNVLCWTLFCMKNG
jgi:hypothetical protein